MDIVLRSPNWIGDCIMTLPAIRALKDHCPKDNIYLVTQPHLAAVYQNLREITKIILISGTKTVASFLFGGSCKFSHKLALRLILVLDIRKWKGSVVVRATPFTLTI